MVSSLAAGVLAEAAPPLRRTAYRAQHFAMAAQGLLAQRAIRALLRLKDESTPEDARLARERSLALLERDLDNVERGYYPSRLLFQYPFGQYIRQAPALFRDIPRSARRMLMRDYQDLPDEVDLRRYPPYYRRNFHWQTDGYLSRRSAEIYDIGVEFLFLGLADVMRRQIIPPVTRFVRESGRTSARLLDVACGTGRTLYQIAIAQPELRLYGLDLSPYYLQTARRTLREVADVSLVAENAEAMPFLDCHFDMVTSVYLFHELPRNARRNVYREMFRVLRPGGLLVIQDSAQLSESGSLASLLERFATEFHEPFYRDYVKDDLASGLVDCGFRIESVESHFVAKVVTARKP